MAIKLKENEIYPITDGNGGVLYARIIEDTLGRYDLDYETRKRRGGKAQFKGPTNVSRRAFRTMVEASGEPV